MPLPFDTERSIQSVSSAAGRSAFIAGWTYYELGRWRFQPGGAANTLGARLYLGALTTAFTLAVVCGAVAAIFSFYAYTLEDRPVRCLYFTQANGGIVRFVFWLFALALLMQHLALAAIGWQFFAHLGWQSGYPAVMAALNIAGFLGVGYYGFREWFAADPEYAAGRKDVQAYYRSVNARRGVEATLSTLNPVLAAAPSTSASAGSSSSSSAAAAAATAANGNGAAADGADAEAGHGAGGGGAGGAGIAGVDQGIDKPTLPHERVLAAWDALGDKAVFLSALALSGVSRFCPGQCKPNGFADAYLIFAVLAVVGANLCVWFYALVSVALRNMEKDGIRRAFVGRVMRASNVFSLVIFNAAMFSVALSLGLVPWGNNFKLSDASLEGQWSSERHAGPFTMFACTAIACAWGVRVFLSALRVGRKAHLAVHGETGWNSDLTDAKRSGSAETGAAATAAAAAAAAAAATVASSSHLVSTGSTSGASGGGDGAGGGGAGAAAAAARHARGSHGSHGRRRRSTLGLLSTYSDGANDSSSTTLELTTVSGGQALLVCFFVHYNIVTFHTDIESLSTDAGTQTAFLYANVLAFGFAFVAVIYSNLVSVGITAIMPSHVARNAFSDAARGMSMCVNLCFQASLFFFLAAFGLFGLAKYKPQHLEPLGWAAAGVTYVMFIRWWLHHKHDGALKAAAAKAGEDEANGMAAAAAAEGSKDATATAAAAVAAVAALETADDEAKTLFANFEVFGGRALYFGAFAFYSVSFLFKPGAATADLYVWCMCVSFIMSFLLVVDNAFVKLLRVDLKTPRQRVEFAAATRPFLQSAFWIFILAMVTFFFGVSLTGTVKKYYASYVGDTDIYIVPFAVVAALGVIVTGAYAFSARALAARVAALPEEHVEVPALPAGKVVTAADLAGRDGLERAQKRVRHRGFNGDRMLTEANTVAGNAAFIAGNVFFEVLFSDAGARHWSTFVYFTLATLTFVLGSLVTVIATAASAFVGEQRSEARRTLLAAAMDVSPIVFGVNLASQYTWILAELVMGDVKYAEVWQVPFICGLAGFALVTRCLVIVRGHWVGQYYAIRGTGTAELSHRDSGYGDSHRAGSHQHHSRAPSAAARGPRVAAGASGAAAPKATAAGGGAERKGVDLG